MSIITPQTNTELFGHENAKADLFAQARDGNLPQGLIISGPRGIGKATLAYRLIRHLLSLSPQGGEGSGGGQESLTRRIATGAHADLLIVSPLFDEKKGEFAKDISVEQAREIAQFLALTPGEGTWRVVLIDPADSLNVNGANAILKILEEPPQQAILILISHMPGALLPTIRSRCRTIKLKPLCLADFKQALHFILPDLLPKRAEQLAKLTAYSPGLATEFESQGAIELYEEMLALIAQFPLIDAKAVQAFAESITASEMHKRMRLLARLALFMIGRVSLRAAGASVDYLNATEENTLIHLAQLYPASHWAMKWQQAEEQFSLAQRLHLDYKSVIVKFFHWLASKEILAASA